ncbi:hypothetical protein [Acidovorax sp. CF316]|uniref:hypothetical protein n=1 Tax=Acidovorax sp. CF316 TaxID=1144317 RepID=UPI00138AF52E|nr:hypothetical protein [Acidovorax sp. CF316]
MTRLLVFPVLSACGAHLTALPPAGLVAQHGLQLQIVPYADAMPKIALDDQPLPCDSLIILFYIRAGAQGLPSGLEILSVRAAKLMEGPLPAGQGLIAGAVVTALVRDAYTVEHLTTADNWRNSIADRAGARLGTLRNGWVSFVQCGRSTYATSEAPISVVV